MGMSFYVSMVKHEAGTDWYLQDEEEYNDKFNLQKVKKS